MSHLEALRAHCMAKPDVTEEYPWGDIVWKVRGKMFAATSESGTGVTVKSTVEKQVALVQHPDIKLAAYVGRYGWVSIELNSEETLELALELIDESYEMVSRKLQKK